MKLHRQSSEINKLFHPTRYDGFSYLSMLGVELIHISKMGPWR